MIALCLFALLAATLARAQQSLSDAQVQSMVSTVLRREDAALHPTTTWLRYRIHKSSPRLATTKWIVETRQGDVARLVEWNDAPLSAEREAIEEQRLRTLASDPGLQQHREEREAADTERLRKIMHALPAAFQYHYAGVIETADGPAYRLTFESKPQFNPFDLEEQVLKGMNGEMWINVAAQRVERLSCTRVRNVDYGLGVFAKLEKGGTLLIEQHPVADGQWRTTQMVLRMNARVFFREVRLDTTLTMTDFAVVQPNMDYRQGIALLRTLAAR